MVCNDNDCLMKSLGDFIIESFLFGTILELGLDFLILRMLSGSNEFRIFWLLSRTLFVLGRSSNALVIPRLASTNLS